MNNTKNRYYLMRHGESLANRRGLIVSHPSNALDDFGITSQGAEQVMQAALSTRLGCKTRIISSDYMRARETATILHSVIAIEHNIEFEPNLRERDFGKWELTDHAHYDEVWQNDLTNPDTSIDGVETVTQVLERTLKVIDSLEQRFTGENILLVGHGDVLQILLAHYHNINPRFHRSLSAIGNADIRSLAKLEINAKSTA